MKNLFFLIVLLFAISCSPTKTIIDTSCPGYKSIDFKRPDISANGIGIMPVLGGDEKEQYRRPMGDAIKENFIQKFGENNIKSTNQVIRILNENNLTDEYTVALNDYRISGIVPKDMVNQLGNALNVDYLLYTRLLADSETRLIKTFGSSSFENFTVDELYIQCQIWDTKIGDVVWEGKGGTAKLNTANSDIINKTAYGLSKIIGNKQDDGPCENKEIIFNSVEEAVMNTYLATGGISLLLCLLILGLM